MRLSKLLILFMILSTFIACSGLLNNNDDSKPTLSIEASEVAGESTTFNGDSLVFDPDFYRDGQPTPDFPAFKLQVNGQKATVSGYYLSPNGGYQPVANIERQGQTLTVTIQPPEDLETITLAAVGWLYEANIQGIEPGTYTLKFVHKSDLMRGEIKDQHTVFSKTVEIE